MKRFFVFRGNMSRDARLTLHGAPLSSLTVWCERKVMPLVEVIFYRLHEHSVLIEDLYIPTDYAI